MTVETRDYGPVLLDPITGEFLHYGPPKSSTQTVERSYFTYYLYKIQYEYGHERLYAPIGYYGDTVYKGTVYVYAPIGCEVAKLAKLYLQLVAMRELIDDKDGGHPSKVQALRDVDKVRFSPVRRVTLEDS